MVSGALARVTGYERVPFFSRASTHTPTPTFSHTLRTCFLHTPHPHLHPQGFPQDAHDDDDVYGAQWVPPSHGVTTRDVVLWSPEVVQEWGRVQCGLSDEDVAVLRFLSGEKLLGYPAYPLTELIEDLKGWGMSEVGAKKTADTYQAQRWAS